MELSRVGPVLVGTLALLWPFILNAAPLSEQQVRAAVQTWVRRVTADAKPDATIARMEAHVARGEIIAYVAHLEGGGFCICGADDLALPVYLYSPKGEYKPSVPDFQFILNEIEERTRRLREAGQKETALAEWSAEDASARAKFWQTLIAGEVPAKHRAGSLFAEPERMELPLTCQWGQWSPYNDRCPVLTPPDERVPVGCNAIAATQIMYYWKWPFSGVGSKSGSYSYRWRTNWDEEPLATNPNPAHLPWRQRLDWTADGGGRLRMTGYWDAIVYAKARELNTNVTYLTALANLFNRLTPATTNYAVNFGAATYNWGVLQDRHTDPVDDGDAEVAKLNFHVAVGCDTSFGLDVSQSDLYRVDDPLRDNLRYDPDVLYTNPRDINAMVEEIEWLRPFALAGGPPGHAWVILGYNKATDPWQFKMNMGWDGGSDNWYTLDQVPLNITNNHNHLTYIAPVNVVRFVGGGVSGDGSPADPYSGIEQAIANAQNGATLIFKAGSDNTFAASTLRIDRPLTLKGANVTIRKQ